MPEEEITRRVNARVVEEFQRLDLLREFFQITDSSHSDLSLCFALWERYGRGPGQPMKRKTAAYFEKGLAYLARRCGVRGIQPGLQGWKPLALDLAREYVPGFRDQRPGRGRRRAWTPFEMLVLAGDVRRERDESGGSVSEACLRLGRLAVWQRWLKSRQWSNRSRPSRKAPAPGEALRKAYGSMDKRFRAVGEEFYRLSAQTGHIDGWLEIRAQITEPR